MRPVTTYNHVQSTAATSWSVKHNLGDYPIIDVYIQAGDGTVQKVLPASVQYVDANTATVTFSTARAGFATVVA